MTAEPDPPSREPLDLSTLRALTHPLRLRILELLSAGPATASGLGRQLAETSGATSYHLRTLERLGFVAELPNHGTARERWWKRTDKLFTVAAGTRETPAYRAAYAQLRSAVLERDARVLADFLNNEHDYPPEWREAALFTNSTLYATPDEIDEIGKQIDKLLAPHRRLHTGDRPEDARRVYVSVHVLPWWR